MRVLVAVLLLAGMPVSAGHGAGAQAGTESGFHRLPLDDALSQNTVTTILQDRRGLMWFGTLAGVDVYDGYRFRNLTSDPRDADSLAGVSVARLLEDREGGIWVAGTAGWVDRIDPASGAVVHVSNQLGGTPDQPGAATAALFEDEGGDIWIGTSSGLHRYRRDSGVLEQNVDAGADNGALPAVTTIATADAGRLWLGTPEGLALFDPAQGSMRRFRHDPGNPRSLSDDRVTAVLTDRDGGLWVGTVEGLNVRAPDDDGFTRYLADPERGESLGANYVRSLLQDRDGHIWIGTQSGGLNRFDQGAFQTFLHHPDDPASLSNNDIWSLFEDRSGLVWIGTAGGGLNQINPSTRRFGTLRSRPFDPRSLRSPFVWDVQEDTEGLIWMATLAGLERFDPQLGNVELFAPQPGDPGMNQLQALHIDVAQRMWVGAVNGRLYRFDPDSRLFRPIVRDDGPGGRFSRDRIWFIDGDAEGRIWVAANEGVFALDAESEAVVDAVLAQPGLPMGAYPVRTMLTDSDGAIWFGGGGVGLIRYQRGHGVTATFGRDRSRPDSLSDNGVRALYESEDGSLWVGSYNGLNRLAPADRRAARNRFRLYTRADGLPGNTVYGILPEGDGRHLWISTNAGLARFDMEQGGFRHFTVHDGLTANEMNGGAELRGSDGRLYFGSVNGLNWFQPQALPINQRSADVAITAVETHRGNAGQSTTASGVRLVLPHDASAFTVHFAVTDYHQPAKNRFRYRMDGTDGSGWVETDQPSVGIAHLVPGQYRLEVMGANNDGVWSSAPAVVDIDVRPPWWRTRAAMAGQLLLLVLAGVVYHLGQRRKLAREREFNEQLGRAHSLAEARHEMAQRYARYDQLTQLPNRTALIDTLGSYMHDARSGTRALAVLLINLDRFQQINDSVGHALGDRVLQVTAERVQACLAAGDFLARVGSDEFALIALAPTDETKDDWPEQVAARVQAAIAAPHLLRESPLVIEAGIGIAVFDGSAAGAGELLGRADVAMHQGKRRGAGSVVRFAPAMRESVRQRLTVEARLRRALSESEFVAHYQPVVAVGSGQVAGFEALIRWLPASGPPVYPDQFIPVAEDSGLIVEIGNWMLNEACRQLAAWQRQGAPNLFVAVNVSMRQLRDGALVPSLRAALAASGLSAAMLKLEITESAMMENIDDTAEQLTAVRQLGVSVSVDDFGTGYSSLGHLKRLPVSEMKIDRSFVGDIATSDDSRKIVASMVRLAHELKLDTVGEGVEDAVCLACLRELGCDFAQGYLISRPIPAAQVQSDGWLDTRTRRAG